MKRLLARHSPLAILSVLCVVLAVLSPSFGTAENVKNLAQRTCTIAIMSMGELLVIITGGIDLSVGSVAALSGVAGAKVIADGGAPVAVGVLVGTLVGASVGLLNGFLVAKGRIQPFIATLGTMMVARGAALVLADGQPVYGLPPAFRWLGGAGGWGVPVVITLIIVAAITVLLNTTRLGRAIYATGGSMQGARLSGLRVARTLLIVYTLSGMCAGFGGMMEASRVSVADPSGAEGYELDAIAACVIGGASLMGGEGAALGPLAGALIMGVLVNFCNLEDIPPYWQRIIVGTLVVALVFYDNWRKRRAGLLRD